MIALRREIQEAMGIVGKSSAMRDLIDLIIKVACTSCTILIMGETGTGKELVARAIHFASPRRDKSLVIVNCAAISKSLQESELFGHEKGAFTGAHKMARGKFEVAKGTSLFLDEIGDTDLAAQAMLLRVIEGQCFTRVGGTIPISSDARVIVATNRNLRARIREGLFREDLYYRLNVVRITVPPLRDRVEDIPLLAAHFLREFCSSRGIPAPPIPIEATTLLKQLPWPGNVRDLRNMMERAATIHDGHLLKMLLQEVQDHQTPPVESRVNSQKAATDQIETASTGELDDRRSREVESTAVREVQATHDLKRTKGWPRHGRRTEDWNPKIIAALEDLRHRLGELFQPNWPIRSAMIEQLFGLGGTAACRLLRDFGFKQRRQGKKTRWIWQPGPITFR